VHAGGGAGELLLFAQGDGVVQAAQVQHGKGFRWVNIAKTA
jgi:hypothetical protein